MKQLRKRPTKSYRSQFSRPNEGKQGMSKWNTLIHACTGFPPAFKIT